MNPFEGHDAATAELRALRAEIKEWTFGIRCLFAVLNVLPLYFCTRLLLSAPRFLSIFQDMLGSIDKLPGLTRLIVMWSGTLLIAVWLVAVVSTVLIFTLKRARHVWIVAAISASMLIATAHLTATMLMAPLVDVIQNLSGSGI